MRYTNEAILKRKKKINKIRKFISIATYLVIVPLLIYNITLIIQAVIKPNETPSFFGIKTYVIISGSMQPELNIGDIVIVKSIKAEELKVGDVISFRDKQNVITHRINKIQNQKDEIEYKTKGDSNNTEDKIVVEFNMIEGKVVGKVPCIGNLVLMLQRKTAIIMIIIIFYGYLLHSEQIKRKKEKRRIKRLEYEKGRKNNVEE